MIYITHENINALIDARQVYAAMRNGAWWQLRRNGQTQTWKRDARRFRIPVKAGLKACYAITETDLIRIDCENGDSVMALNPDNFRHVDDTPKADARKR
jgi:hypothetical protein